MKAIVNGKIVLPGRVVSDMALLYSDKIAGLTNPRSIEDAEVIDAGGMYVLPGLIDMHIHGYMGADASDGDAEGIRDMARGIARNGVTAWLPTTMTVSYGQLRKAFAAISEVMAESIKSDFMGAQIMGVNAEGPFINPEKKGAQAADHIRPCDPEFIDEYANLIRVFTVAPEVGDNINAIRRISKAHPEILISIGHTSATFEQALEAVRAGARHVTHLFNAQTPLKHRDPGVAGLALTQSRVSTELIADTFHINKVLFKLVADAKRDKLVLITDCTRAGGLEDGEYTLGGQPIYVKGIQCRLADGTIAGSVLKLNEAVRNMRAANPRAPIYKAVNMASLYPARAIGIADIKGSLEPGKDADMCIMNDKFEVLSTISRGRMIYKA